jgi:transcriptional regulator GlxA family with amidase domain
MSDQEQHEPMADEETAPTRKRPKPGERRLQILQTLAAMLEQPGAERVTTAGLAAKIGVSEAALYRHFASGKSPTAKVQGPSRPAASWRCCFSLPRKTPA